jgi:hypothetical protein
MFGCGESLGWAPGRDGCDGANSQVVEGEELCDTTEYHKHGNDEVHDAAAVCVSYHSRSLTPQNAREQPRSRLGTPSPSASFARRTYKMSEKSMMA